MSYRIVACIPAGRQRYMELLVPHLLRARQLLSEVQLWLNTAVPDDVSYLRGLATLHPGFFRIIEPEQTPGGFKTICQFWSHAIDPATIYVRTDDDIVWMAGDAIEKLVQHRLEHPDAFMVFGNTVNNAICSYLHQQQGCIPRSAGLATLSATCSLAWRSAFFGEAAHRTFLQHLEEGRTNDYLFTRWILGSYPRFGINVCCWFGRDFRSGDPHLMKGEEEHWVSCVRPRQLARPNEICGQALFSHFAYYLQRYGLDRTDLLQQYQRYLPGA